MQNHIAHVALGDASTDVAAAILQMNQHFAAGVPADDRSCEQLIALLQWLEADGDKPTRNPDQVAMSTTVFSDGVKYDGITKVPIEISTDFFLTICFLESGYLANDHLELNVYQRRRAADGDRLLWSDLLEPSPTGLRDLLRVARRIATDLRKRGLCGRCPDRESAFIRLPGADYCRRCCLAAAVLGV